MSILGVRQPPGEVPLLFVRHVPCGWLNPADDPAAAEMRPFIHAESVARFDFSPSWDMLGEQGHQDCAGIFAGLNVRT